MPPQFYSPYDQSVYESGFQYIPQRKYLLDDFNLPGGEDDGGSDLTQPVSGIAAINLGGGGGGFNPYNTNMNTIRRDYNPFPSRQAGEVFSKTFNPQPNVFAGGLSSVQSAYNMATDAINRNFGDVIAKDNPNFKFYRGDKSVFQMQKDADDMIQDEKMRYATEGQFVDPFDPRYSSMTEAQKFMDNYPEYYGVSSGVPEEGLLGLAQNYVKNSLLGRGVGLVSDFLGRVMPINQRAIMENEARGEGIFTDDIGRIVTDDYNTAGGIMAGYNLNKIDADTFDKRRARIEKTIEDKKNKGLDTSVLENRLDLLDEAEEDILGSRKRTAEIIRLRNAKKLMDSKTIQNIPDTGDDKGTPPGGDTDYQDYGQGGASAAEMASYEGDDGSYAGASTEDYGGGEKDGGFIDGTNRRIDFMIGGLADLVDIYD